MLRCANFLTELRSAAVAVVSLATIWSCPGHSQAIVSADTSGIAVLRAVARHVDTTIVGGKRYLNPIVLVYPSQTAPLEHWDGVELSMLQSTLKATVGLSTASELFASDSSYRVIVRFGRPTLVSDGGYEVPVGFVVRGGTEARRLSVRKVGEKWAVVNDRWIGGS